MKGFVADKKLDVIENRWQSLMAKIGEPDLLIVPTPGGEGKRKFFSDQNQRLTWRDDAVKIQAGIA